jgi:predicted metal-dependent enzyme (double-stranded beta helix superfamily)
MANPLKEFIEALEQLTRASTPARPALEVAPLLARLLGEPDVIPDAFQRLAPDGGRGRYMLHRGERFNVTSVVWAPGEAVQAHEHRTWGVIGVVRNRIRETRYRLAPNGRPQARAILEHAAGAVSCLIPPDDDIHAMHNPTTEPTLEIHVYGRDLVGMPRRTWTAPGEERLLLAGKYLNC